MKKIICIILSIMMIIMSSTLAFASTSTEQYGADILYSLGLLSGSGMDSLGMPDYKLDNTPTRAEAITMLVRLLGKEEEAKNSFYSMPFTDVPSWAVPYVGFAFENGLTSGVSAVKFGSNDKITATQYLTLVLRALGYSTGVDFEWDSAWTLSDELGITSGQYNNDNQTNFTRGNMISISCEALSSKLKDSNITMLDQLKKDNAVPKNAKFAIDEKRVLLTSARRIMLTNILIFLNQ